MNKKIIIGLSVLVIVILGGLVAVSNQPSSNSPREELVVKEDAPKNDALLSKGERYVEYSKTYLDQEVNSRRVLYFYASWCPTCRPADADFEANKYKIPQDTVVFRVNYNDSETDQEEKDLAKKYAVTYQHTFVQIDKEGNEITKWNGGKTDELLANLK